MPPVTYVTNPAQAVLVAVTAALSNFLGFLPGLVGAILVLIIGWILAGALATLIERGLRAIGFERAVDRGGIGAFLARTGTTWTASKVVAELVKWFVFLIFAQAAANVLGMPQVTAIVNSIVLYIPNVVVALVVLVAGSLIARLASDLVRGTARQMGLGSPNLLAAVTRYAILGFAVVAAVDQLRIASTLLYALVIGFIGALALAFGLAFGLGGREVAADITRNWYHAGQDAAERVRARTEQAAAGGAARPVKPAQTATPASRANPPRQAGPSI